MALKELDVGSTANELDVVLYGLRGARSELWKGDERLSVEPAPRPRQEAECSASARCCWTQQPRWRAQEPQDAVAHEVASAA